MDKKERTIEIRTVADMQRELTLFANNPKTKDTTYVANVNTPIGVNNDNMHVIGDWKLMDIGNGKLSTKGLDTNGIYTTVADQVWSYDDWADKTRLHNIVANPTDGATPMSTVADYSRYVAVGQNVVRELPAQTRMIDVTAEMAADFSTVFWEIMDESENVKLDWNFNGHALVIRDDNIYDIDFVVNRLIHSTYTLT